MLLHAAIGMILRCKTTGLAFPYHTFYRSIGNVLNAAESIVKNYQQVIGIDTAEITEG